MPTLPGDTSGAATAINDHGQVVGISGTCDQAVGRFTAAHAVLWENGNAIDLGLLPEAGQGSNEFGQTAHVSTAAIDVNSSGTIVGTSFPVATTPQLRPGPFVHRNGVMTNLNDLLAPGSESWVIRAVSSINDSGVIAGSANTLEDNDSRAVLLVPVGVLRHRESAPHPVQR